MAKSEVKCRAVTAFAGLVLGQVNKVSGSTVGVYVVYEVSPNRSFVRSFCYATKPKSQKLPTSLVVCKTTMTAVHWSSPDALDWCMTLQPLMDSEDE
ncbi:unnamed protein product [Soboliphyme baturini]|uniref:Cystatin domain-containing protein n=1 Tax=Soboliphyme baturini TaxID=241478 RepID=A0A183IEJ7_9BILA|nr:unnamed protein product [Soboliphyme baturini]